MACRYEFSNINCYSTVSLSRWFPLSTWQLAGEIGSVGVRLVSSDHGLFHDPRRALILINPHILLIWTIGNKAQRKTKEFSRDEANLKMSSTQWQSFCITATLTGGVYLPVGVVTLHNSSLAHWGRVPYLKSCVAPNQGPISLTTFPL